MSGEEEENAAELKIGDGTWLNSSFFDSLIMFSESILFKVDWVLFFFFFFFNFHICFCD